MARSDPSLVVRLPADLKQRLRCEAKKESRTLTGQVVYLLRQSLPEEDEKATEAGTSIAE